MSIADQCRLLRLLYQKKYCNQSTIRNQIKQSQQLRIKFSEHQLKNQIQRVKKYRISKFQQSIQYSRSQDKSIQGQYQIEVKQKQQEKDRLEQVSRQIQHSKETSKQKFLSLMTQHKNKLYDFSYCNQPIEIRPFSYRQFTVSKDRRRVKSVSGTRSLLHANPKQADCKINAKNAVLHTRQSHYITLLNQRKSKHKITNSINTDQIRNIIKYHPDNRNRSNTHFVRNTISEARKRTTLTVLRNRNKNRDGKRTSDAKRDDNDVLPWNVDNDQFLYKEV